MTMDSIISILTPILPTIFLIMGGQFVLNQYDARKKDREQRVELARAVREKQYEQENALFFAHRLAAKKNVDGLPHFHLAF